jgi:uncharacterized membrane protein
MKALPTKRSTVMGLPVGRRRTDWARVGKIGALGVGAVSTAAGGVGAKRAGGRLKDTVSSQVEQGQETIQKVGQAADRASSIGKSVGGPISKVSSAVGSLTGSSSSGDEGGGDGDGDDGGRENLKKLRLIIKEGIDVGVPLKTAYNQWTQFADMPEYMKGVQSVDQEEDDENRWTVKIGPSRRNWTAKILEQVPDERIVWQSTEGTENRGTVTFHRLDRNLTRVHVEMEYFPNGFVEKVGNVFLMARKRVRKDLRLFRHFLELNGEETGEWRGEIAGGDSESEGSEGEGSEARETEDQAESNGRAAAGDSDESEGDQEESEDRRQASKT